MIKTFLQWIGPVFGTAGYPLIGAAIVLERTIFLGLVVPGDVVLAIGGIYAARQELSITWVIAIASVAGIVGESTGYWLGRRFGKSLIGRIPLVRRLEDKLDEAEGYFDKHGGKTVAIGRFATAAGSFVPFTAGAARMPYHRFVLYDVPSVLVWASGIALVGYFFGRNVETVDTILSRFGWIVLGALVAFVAGYVVVKRRRGRARPGAKKP